MTHVTCIEYYRQEMHNPFSPLQEAVGLLFNAIHNALLYRTGGVFPPDPSMIDDDVEDLWNIEDRVDELWGTLDEIIRTTNISPEVLEDYQGSLNAYYEYLVRNKKTLALFVQEQLIMNVVGKLKLLLL